MLHRTHMTLMLCTAMLVTLTACQSSQDVVALQTTKPASLNHVTSNESEQHVASTGAQGSHDLPGVASVTIPEYLRFTASQLFERYARCDLPTGESFDSKIVDYQFRKIMHEQFMRDNDGHMIPKKRSGSATVFNHRVQKIANHLGMIPSVVFYIDADGIPFELLTSQLQKKIHPQFVCEGEQEANDKTTVCYHDWGNGNSSFVMKTSESPRQYLMGCLLPYQP